MTNDSHQIDLTYMPAILRIVLMKQKHEDIDSGKEIMILAIPNAKEPIFEVECEGKIRNIPIDCFNHMYLSHEISNLFPDWRPC